jgi:hypothetical protein
MCSALERTAARDVHSAIFKILVASCSLWVSWQGFCTCRCLVSKKRKKLPVPRVTKISTIHLFILNLTRAVWGLPLYMWMFQIDHAWWSHTTIYWIYIPRVWWFVIIQTILQKCTLISQRYSTKFDSSEPLTLLKALRTQLRRATGGYYRGGLPEGGLSRRIIVTLSIFNFRTWFLVQIVENLEGRLSRPFLGHGDNFPKSCDENQIRSERVHARAGLMRRSQVPYSCHTNLFSS